jgi:ribosomal protein S12 methylthiotransferase accessory factor
MVSAAKTMIKGKNLDLETTIETMLGKLQRVGIEIEEVSWLNPVPEVYSVHVRDRHCHANFTNGKGTSRKACLASALGEFCERFSTGLFFADYYLGPALADEAPVYGPRERWLPCSAGDWRDSLLNEQLWTFYDPDGELEPEHLVGGNTEPDGRGICVLPYTALGDGKTVWFPVNLLANLYVSNGMAAGNTKTEARVEALSEILERYVKNKVIAEGLCLPRVPEAVVARFPRIHGMISELQAHGYHLRVADASLGGHFPVVSVTLINPDCGSVFASFGAHPCFEIAFERTVVELLQGRRLDQLDGFQPPTFDLASVAEAYNLEEHFVSSSGRLCYDFFREKADYPFVDWNYEAGTAEECAFLGETIRRAGFEVYVADFEPLGVYACRIIVPGMSEIYGVDDLQWNNKNEGAMFRREILALNKLVPADWQELLECLEEGGHADAANVAEFIGILPDPGSPWESLRLGELKAMLCLAIGDHEESLQWVEWCLNMGHLSPEKIRHCRCLQALLHIALERDGDFADYAPSLILMYGEDTLAETLRVLRREERFAGLVFSGPGLQGFQAHASLLQAYDKLRRGWPSAPKARCYESPGCNPGSGAPQ